MSKLTVEQRVQRAHIWLMNEPKYCLYSGLFMMGTTEVLDDGCPTAYTDGFNTKYGRAFIETLQDEELRGLILHENLHKAFRHLTTWVDLYKEDRKRANMACDFVINLMIYDSDPTGKDVRMPKGGCLDEQYRGMDAGTVFRLLKDNDDGGGNGKGSGDDGSEEETGGGLDEHGWDEAQEMSTKEREEISNQIDQALRQGALLAGKMKGAMPREITELLETKVDWREALRDFITTFCAEREISTWRKPNRRWVDRDVYLPSAIGESVGRLAVAIDTSGSIDNKVIGEFLSQVRHICTTVMPEAIDLIYWDTSVCQHEVYDRDAFDSLIASTKPRGGGGTNPQCVSDYIRAKKLQPEAIVVLTDGYVDSWGTHWTAPILWGVTTKHKQSNVGLTIYIGD